MVKVIIKVEIETVTMDIEELWDMESAVKDVCKEWGHAAEVCGYIEK